MSRDLEPEAEAHPKRAAEPGPTADSSPGAEPKTGSAPTLLQRIPEGRIHSTEAILDRFLAWVDATGLTPYEAQEQALLELMTDAHLILSTPTGSGKSLVALGLHFKAMCEGRRSFYTAPIKALVSEKFFALCDQFGAENVGMLTGDASINWAAPIICCTAEVLSNMAVHQGRQSDAPYVIMDEFHYYSDRDRGIAWQLPLLVLRESTFLLMSATLGNVSNIAKHIEKRTGKPVAMVHSEQRPVPLDFEYRETPLLETIEALLGQRKQPIYIVHFTQREASEQAQSLTSANLADRAEKTRINEALSGFRFDTPYGKDVRRFLQHGIGVHHAGLLPKYRLLVEQLAQQGLLKVICGTDTLGVGVNIPIRTVLFTKLSKFDGEKVTILSVRDFKQISGRAGRKGFDEQGSVVCQAPEHVIENQRLTLKAAANPHKKRSIRKKQAPRGFVAWNLDTMNRLIYSPAETLASRFRVSHGLLVSCLQSEENPEAPGAGYRKLLHLIELCHETDSVKRRLRREAAVLFRSLREAGVIEFVHSAGSARPRVQVNADLQRDFSLYQTLSLYLVEAATVLETKSPSHCLDVLSLVEAVLENPRAILHQMVYKAKSDLIAELKAKRVPYEERMSKLEEVSWTKPNAEFIYTTFNLFAEKHPWVRSENIHPKSIAREMYESYSSFEDFVRRFGLARMEGTLLRYLGQVHNTLNRSVPDAVKTDEVYDLLAYLRTMLLQVDSSLIQEWESMLRPKAEAPGDGAQTATPPRQRGLADDPKALRARIRGELHALTRALAQGHFEETATLVHPDCAEEWPPERFENELGPFYEQYERIIFAPAARAAHLTRIEKIEPGRWEVRQVLLDEQDDNFWNIEGEVDLRSESGGEGALLRIRRISD